MSSFYWTYARYHSKYFTYIILFNPHISFKENAIFFFFHTHTHCILFLQEVNRLAPSIVSPDELLLIRTPCSPTLWKEQNLSQLWDT